MTAKNKQYEGLHPKNIHLDPTVFEILEWDAKRQGRNLKNYIEHELNEKARALYMEMKEVHEARNSQ
jgi:predicted HicB family RNase H-like nuclease